MSANENCDWKKTCAKCMDGDIEPRHCEYYGEPNGCNSPTYGEHPNVGNSAKMRETIEWLKERLTAAVYDGSLDVHEALDKIDAALAAPARVCDVIDDPVDDIKAKWDAAFLKHGCALSDSVKAICMENAHAAIEVFFGPLTEGCVE